MDTPWLGLRKWFSSLRELDLMTMRFANVWSLLELVGPQLESLTLELDDEQVESLTHFLFCIVLFHKLPQRSFIGQCRKEVFAGRHLAVARPRTARLTKYFFVWQEKNLIPQTCHFSQLSYDQSSHRTGYLRYWYETKGKQSLDNQIFIYESSSMITYIAFEL